MPQQQRGFSVLELLAVLALVGTILGIAYGKSRATRERNERDAFVAGITSVVDSAKREQPSTGWRDYDPARLWRSAPETWQDSTAGNMVSNYGGTVVVARVAHGGAANAALQFTTPVIPKNACGSVIDRLQPLFARISVNGQSVKAWGTDAATVSSNATARCTSDLNNSIVWTLL